MPKPHDDKTIIDPLRWQYWNDLKGTRFFFGSIFWQQRKNEFFSINKRQFSICKKWLIVHSWQDHRYMKMYWILSTKNRFSNPAHQSFTIKDAKDIHQIERIDLSGKLVLIGTPYVDQIHLPHLPMGVYNYKSLWSTSCSNRTKQIGYWLNH